MGKTENSHKAMRTNADQKKYIQKIPQMFNYSNFYKIKLLIFNSMAKRSTGKIRLIDEHRISK